MGLGDLQLYDIIIFAGIAVFLVYRLRNVLGKRTGFEKNITNTKYPTPITAARAKKLTISVKYTFTVFIIKNSLNNIYCIYRLKMTLSF